MNLTSLSGVHTEWHELPSTLYLRVPGCLTTRLMGDSILPRSGHSADRTSRFRCEVGQGLSSANSAAALNKCCHGTVKSCCRWWFRDPFFQEFLGSIAFHQGECVGTISPYADDFFWQSLKACADMFGVVQQAVQKLATMQSPGIFVADNNVRLRYTTASILGCRGVRAI